MNPSETAIAYIGLGSNLADPVSQLKSARTAIRALKGLRELAFSSLYYSLPMGPQDQPDYFNAVIAVETTLLPMVLLRALQTIENAQGRIRKTERWGPRTLDLDILLYNDQTIDLPDLTVPHSGITERAFVLYPLFEIAPQIQVPGHGALTNLLSQCPLAGLKRLD
jgi:2-amino-4-hydroxy-6-hydroxymethyldihydropteridine diphosphokinase